MRVAYVECVVRDCPNHGVAKLPDPDLSEEELAYSWFCREHLPGRS